MPPTMLIDALNGIRRRVKILGVAYGVGVALAAAIGLLLFTVFADYLLNLPAWPRCVLLIAALAGVAYTIGRWVFKPRGLEAHPLRCRRPARTCVPAIR